MKIHVLLCIISVSVLRADGDLIGKIKKDKAATLVLAVRDNSVVRGKAQGSWGWAIRIPLQRVRAVGKRGQWYKVLYRTVNNVGWSKAKIGYMHEKYVITGGEYAAQVKDKKRARQRRIQQLEADKRPRHVQPPMITQHSSLATAYEDEAHRHGMSVYDYMNYDNKQQKEQKRIERMERDIDQMKKDAGVPFIKRHPW